MNKPSHMFFAWLKRQPEHPGQMAPCPPAAFRVGLSSATSKRRLPLYLRHSPRVLWRADLESCNLVRHRDPCPCVGALRLAYVKGEAGQGSTRKRQRRSPPEDMEPDAKPHHTGCHPKPQIRCSSSSHYCRINSATNGYRASSDPKRRSGSIFNSNSSDF